jgi:hypothetical protein
MSVLFIIMFLIIAVIESKRDDEDAYLKIKEHIKRITIVTVILFIIFLFLF